MRHSLAVILIAVLALSVLAPGLALAQSCSECAPPTKTPPVDPDKPMPDVHITKSVSTNTLEPGETVTYQIVVENTGTGDATGVVIEDAADSVFAAALASQTWTPGYLAPGESVIFTYDIAVDENVPDGIYDNTATVTGTNFLTQSATATVSVTTSAPVLTLETSVVPATLNAASSTEYTVRVENIGRGTAENVVVTATLPDGFSEQGPVVLEWLGIAPVFAAGDVLVWHLGDLASGEAWETSATVDVGANVVNGVYGVPTLLTSDNHVDLNSHDEITVVGEVLGFTALPETGGVEYALLTFIVIALASLGTYLIAVTAPREK